MAKATHTTDREQVRKLTEIQNIGPSMAADLESLGIATPQQLKGQDPLCLYQQLIHQTGHFHDPCVLDAFMSAVDFMNGRPPKEWWSYTEERKRRYQSEVDRLR